MSGPTIKDSAGLNEKALIVSALTGGAYDALDSLNTVGVPTPRIYQVLLGNSLQFFRLRKRVGGDVIDGINLVSPLDYNASTNNVVLAIMDISDGLVALHASTHAAGGTDPLTPDAIGAATTAALAAEAYARAAADALLQPLDADLTAIAALSTQAFGRSLLTGANAGAVNTLLGLAALYQPLENQRLSTGDVPAFAGLTLNGPLAGVSGDAINNYPSGVWDFGFSDVRSRNLILYDGGAGPDGQINYHSSVSTFEFGGSDLGIIGSINFAYNLTGGSGDWFSNPSSGLWDFLSAGVSFASGNMTVSTGGDVTCGNIYSNNIFNTAGGSITWLGEGQSWVIDGGLVVTGGGASFDGGYIQTDGAGTLSAMNANVYGTLTTTNITSEDGEVDFLVGIRAKHLLTSGNPAYELGGVLYYPHAAAGVLSFTTTP